MRTLPRVIGVAVAVAAAFVLIAQGLGLVSLVPADDAKEPPPAHRLLPLTTPTALAALGPYAEGPEGIKMPDSEAVTGLTAEEVAQGYELAKKLLTVAHLDPGVLYEGETEPYARLLSAHQRDQFRKGLSSDAAATTTRDEVTAFVPGTSQKSEPIRVRGRAEPKADTVTGSDGKPYQGILLKIDFEFVYPLSTGEVIEERQGEMFVTKGGGKGAKVEVWTGQWKGVVHGATCETKDGFLHPGTPESLCTRPSA
ncbi:hypothetical protein [Actinocorallia longicatena]|uniref:Uncharacterized protein n=1 Tax=Actinocorallia longicatena TaxID=111803 RepID=A0ABP6QHJ8_9ACTN